MGLPFLLFYHKIYISYDLIIVEIFELQARHLNLQIKCENIVSLIGYSFLIHNKCI